MPLDRENSATLFDCQHDLTAVCFSLRACSSTCLSSSGLQSARDLLFAPTPQLPNAEGNCGPPASKVGWDGARAFRLSDLEKHWPGHAPEFPPRGKRHATSFAAAQRLPTYRLPASKSSRAPVPAPQGSSGSYRDTAYPQ